MFGWWRSWRKPPAIPDALWEGILREYPFLAQREAGELAKLRSMASRFLVEKEFHGAHGLRVTDAMAVAIAAQAVLPVLHLGLHWYDDFVGIVLHRREVVARRTQEDEAGVVHRFVEVLAGEAMEGGPVMLSWRDVARSGQSAAQGYNVVVHEFAHKLDMRDGQPDGCPPLPSVAARKEWLRVLHAEYSAFREKALIAQRFSGEPPWLDTYAAESVDEFFAVACEGYFVNRPRFVHDFPALAQQFDTFFLPPAAH